MKPPGADSNLRTKSIAKAVGKSRRGVVKDTRTVDPVQECLSGHRVLSDDALCVAAPVGVNSVDGLIQRVDHTHRQAEISVFSPTILWSCGLRISEALNLNVGDIPADGALVITGKGNKQRLVLYDSSTKEEQ